MKTRTFADTALAVATVTLPVAFVATLLLVSDRAPALRTVHLVGFALATWAVAAARLARADERLDEVELAAARFGARWGLVGGFALISLLSVLPAVQPLLADVANAFSRIEDQAMTGESRLFLFGGLVTFLSQEALRSAFTAAWTRSKR